MVCTAYILVFGKDVSTTSLTTTMILHRVIHRTHKNDTRIIGYRVPGKKSSCSYTNVRKKKSIFSKLLIVIYTSILPSIFSFATVCLREKEISRVIGNNEAFKCNTCCQPRRQKLFWPESTVLFSPNIFYTVNSYPNFLQIFVLIIISISFSFLFSLSEHAFNTFFKIYPHTYLLYTFRSTFCFCSIVM